MHGVGVGQRIDVQQSHGEPREGRVVAGPQAERAFVESRRLARRILDLVGLVSPEAIRFLPVPEEQRMGPAAGAISGCCWAARGC